MFWIVLILLWSYPGFRWSVAQKMNTFPKERLDPEERSELNSKELLYTLSWPMGYALIFFTHYSLGAKVGIVVLLHLILIWFVQPALITSLREKQKRQLELFKKQLDSLSSMNKK